MHSQSRDWPLAHSGFLEVERSMKRKRATREQIYKACEMIENPRTLYPFMCSTLAHAGADERCIGEFFAQRTSVWNWDEVDPGFAYAPFGSKKLSNARILCLLMYLEARKDL